MEIFLDDFFFLRLWKRRAVVYRIIIVIRFYGLQKKKSRKIVKINITVIIRKRNSI